MKTRHRRGDDQEHDNADRWLLTYSDMITLLMALFVVLYAISQLDAQKFQMLSQGLAKSFGAPVKILDGGDGIMRQTGSTVTKDQLAPDLRPTPDPQAVQQAAKAEASRLREAEEQIKAALRAKGMRDKVAFRIEERGLVVSIVTDEVLFPADRAELQAGGREVLDVIAPVLRDLPDQLAVEGHTNTVPVKPRYYPTEWELSAARAVSVVRYLYQQDRVPEKRLQATAFADQHPLYPASDPRSTRLNRRVEIVVLSSAPTQVRDLLPSMASGQ